MSILRIIAILFLSISLPVLSVAQTSDTQAPTVVELGFSPAAIDVTVGPVEVTVTARITDDLAGSNFAHLVRFLSSSEEQFHEGVIVRTAGDELDGIYSGTVQIPEFVESGTWTILIWSLRDVVGNFSILDAATLASLEFPTDLEVTSNEDTIAPVIESATISPNTVDVSAGPQSVTVELHITDNVSGVDLQRLQASLIDASTNQRRHVFSNSFSNTSGTAFDGIWEASFAIPQYSASGPWELLLFNVDDMAGNSHSFLRDLADVVVDSTPEDVSVPALIDFQFTPTVIDTSAGSAVVAVSLTMSDALSGVDFQSDSFFHGVTFRSPSRGQQRSIGNTSLIRITGNLNYGEWQGEIYFPQFSEDGSWNAELSIADLVHNFGFLTGNQLASAGFSTELVVVRPSLDSDGSVTSAGGSITDDTFQFGTTSLTLPLNAVAENTSVAIDVFPDPLAVDNPVGFQGPGTFFVNFALDPEPDFPFPIPGASVTLPLPNPLPVGTEIPLYFVDENSGILMPMPNVNGGQVVGFVNGDAISATFSGLSHFSILVGLLPAAPSTTVFSLASNSVTVNENSGSAALTVNRTGATESAASVDYQSSDGTAEAGEDYSLVNGTLLFEAGQTSAIITVPITNDGLLESPINETFTITLSNPSTGSLGANTTATVQIVDDSSAPILAFDVATLAVNENAGTVALTVIRTGAGNAVNVDYNSNDGSATAGEDYTALTGRLHFAAGQNSASITVSIIDDALVEAAKETFTVSLHNPNGGAKLGASSVQISINDDDGAAPPPTLPARTTLTSDGSATTAIIHGAVTADDGASLSESFSVGEAIQVPILIVPEVSDVGAVAEIFVVASDGSNFIQVTPAGFLVFDGTAESLIALDEIVLAQTTNVDILEPFGGQLTLTNAELGSWLIFVGYSTGNGVITFNDEPIELRVNE